ncbi:MAG: hypothetical protein JSU87_10590 [Gemmatimonadota bacterium]|nr:MAG: hypothetical protein JSU87_10590 [Gemmatimonadota bacterium]
MMQDAIDRAADWLLERRDFYGFLSRRDRGRGAPELARHLRGDLLARQGADGSWNEGDLAVSSEAIWSLLDLGLTPDTQAVARGLDWMYGQRDQDGSYGVGCTPARHEQGICEHFVSGFFSLGPADEPQEIVLSNGQAVTSDVGARLLASERALRSALRANPHDARSAASIAGLRGLPLYLDYGGSFTPAVLVGAIQALAWARGVGMTELEAGLESLAAAQDSDGTWPNVEFFFVVEALLEVKHRAASEMLKRVAPRLLETQHKYGAWGRRFQAAQSSIALRALERVFAESSGRG